MTKLKFLFALHKQLSDLPQEDVEERLNFYAEMIEDRIEEGLCEEDAVAAVGSVEEIAAQIRAEVSPAAPAASADSAVPAAPVAPAANAPAAKSSLDAWQILLLVLGSPIWLSLLIAVFAVIFSLYVTLWSLVISLWAVFASFAGCAVGGLAGGAGFLIAGHSPAGIALLAAAAVCTGLAILAFLGCKAATVGSARLTKSTLLQIGNCFKRKETTQ